MIFHFLPMTDTCLLLPIKCARSISVKCDSNYSVQNDESLHGHCANERRLRNRKREEM